MCSTKTKRNRRRCVAYPRVSNNKNLPYLLEEMAQCVFLKVENLRHGSTLFFPFFIFMILSVEQMNLDDKCTTKQKR
jgi:hypothetical protein